MRASHATFPLSDSKQLRGCLHRAPSRAVPARRDGIGIMIVLVAQLMLTLDTTIANVALPQIAGGLGFGHGSLSWVLNAYTLAFGGLLLTGGRLGDIFGRLRVFEIGLAVFTAASLAGGLATSPGMLVTARAVQGLGAVLAAPGVLALVATSARDEAARHRSLPVNHTPTDRPGSPPPRCSRGGWMWSVRI
ncbi:MFS transporter [Streptomyces sp. NBC_01462]|uniref:MFS transporter n=1 Tax=Streptomyces sp. NBC_01462 TaxID=2903876 RepID=UPI002E35205D|nr:MFS transporter [Streptomyces sp. NBC_01462]